MTGITPALQSQNFADNAAEFTDFYKFEIRIRTNGSGSAGVYRASLSVRLIDLQVGETFFRVATQSFAGGEASFYYEDRALIDSSRFSTPTLYFEILGGSPFFVGSATAGLRDAGVNPTGPGSNLAIAGSTLTIPSSRNPARTAAVTFQDGDNAFADISVSS